jgi:Na+/H+ antiporter NhaD/arsenite permease-like protein
METSMSRKIWSVIGLVIAMIMVTPVDNTLADLHGHTTKAAVYLAMFIVGMVIAWTSVMSPVYQKPTAREQKQAVIKAKKQEEKGDKTTFWLGIAVLAMALFLVFISPSFIFGSGGYAVSWIILIICGIVMIIFSRPKKKA